MINDNTVEKIHLIAMKSPLKLCVWILWRTCNEKQDKCWKKLQKLVYKK